MNFNTRSFRYSPDPDSSAGTSDVFSNGTSRIWAAADGTDSAETVAELLRAPSFPSDDAELNAVIVRFDGVTLSFRTYGSAGFYYFRQGELLTDTSAPVSCQEGDSFLFCTGSFEENINPLEMELDLYKAAVLKDWLHLMARRVLMRLRRRPVETPFCLTCVSLIKD